MIEQLLNAYDFNLEYAKRLVVGIPDKDAARSGGPGLENSPLFSMGHLVTGAGMTAHSFHGENTVEEEIRRTFERRGPNDQRTADVTDSHFRLQVLVAELERQHELVKSGIRDCPPERWATPESWRLDRYFPTFADATWFMCVTHEALHLGQIAAWRRWYGLPSAMATM